jgi:hypothetical protein
MQRHFEDTEFHTNPTSNRCVPVVVVGSATAPASNEEPHEIVLAAVPVMAIHNFWKFVGVPDRLVVIDVMFDVCPVMVTAS